MIYSMFYFPNFLGYLHWLILTRESGYLHWLVLRAEARTATRDERGEMR